MLGPRERRPRRRGGGPARRPGGAVHLRGRTPDPYAFCAVEVWPADREPDRSAVVEVEGLSSVLSSTLTLTFDDDDSED
ncbi:hypothetical protein GCM10023340_34890 [Nocardioides marinquilinus]|uniref:Uncharacterized protein n=1 Tax=Nocardioides marinquilinus TaxID=1210400 RepID=A0ABP9Q152_9ACTN